MSKRIILVEDDAAIIDIYQTVMAKSHFDVQVLSLGADVLKEIKEIEEGKVPSPAALLLDLILPDMNGIDILVQIRKNHATKDMKVFILTNQENAEKQMPEGIKADKIIIKANTSPTDLVEIIKKAVT
ncbi:MAG: hypothetical protein A3C50_02270 [Candidatus Staskawiczbacteria bacterium RIFCSPHIGHO2_02_FULL_43_16]|uniref:Response regulatory domain-containing protein n=1 Tax=Candidatus Staskawiczbacteria bacterium RIFCSPHIGHO2_01_FULL_41_41 TaxID=1802203 RepID=A0A1G2HWW1_9BACT|nr:MAG: hypothetical protein A2822_00640 [Candidatus Staskawiczbacteria bacterium RIFCSPHIGHO2_01_FULL_41_41]OGZ68503.1 MAG: hypothetical protein A3C50_02270 [Candidatus Staskawiczbacteria bacterium RIFCSPHIGHO2_02_FULL_43_16]OGZ74307.1 MAG: hypothetical protein A3A12_02705 [Candidatus Staskawiczbacteria bacterium RIFCSPLOWO2_01_FULL_43_17b]